jgi:hypothetical protein
MMQSNRQGKRPEAGAHASEPGSEFMPVVPNGADSQVAPKVEVAAPQLDVREAVTNSFTNRLGPTRPSRVSVLAGAALAARLGSPRLPERELCEKFEWELEQCKRTLVMCALTLMTMLSKSKAPYCDCPTSVLGIMRTYFLICTPTLVTMLSSSKVLSRGALARMRTPYIS